MEIVVGTSQLLKVVCHTLCLKIQVPYKISNLDMIHINLVLPVTLVKSKHQRPSEIELCIFFIVTDKKIPENPYNDTLEYTSINTHTLD